MSKETGMFQVVAVGIWWLFWLKVKLREIREESRIRQKPNSNYCNLEKYLVNKCFPYSSTLNLQYNSHSHPAYQTPHVHGIFRQKLLGGVCCLLPFGKNLLSLVCIPSKVSISSNIPFNSTSSPSNWFAQKPLAQNFILYLIKSTYFSLCKPSIPLLSSFPEVHSIMSGISMPL